jgi:hypothetical protein
MCVAIGATMPTGFADAWDVDKLMEAMQRWAVGGLAQAELMHVDDVAEMLAAAFATALALPGIGMEQITLRSPSKAGASLDEMTAWAADHGGPELPVQGGT